MQLRSLTLREIHLKLLSPFETSMDRVTERRILLAELNLDNASGWSECTAGENPFYSPEDTETSCHILTTYLWPMLKGKHIQSAAANSAYRAEDLQLLQQLDAFYLMMIEQPLGWDDLFGHVAIQKNLQTPSASTSASIPTNKPKPPSPSAPAKSSTSSSAASAATCKPNASTTSAPKIPSPSGAAACSNPA